MNSFKHGLTSTKVYPAASQEEFQALASRYHDELQPVGVEEEQKLELLVHTRWSLRRLYAMQEQVWETLLREDAGETPSELLIADCRGANVIGKLHRYLRDLQRTYDRASQDLKYTQHQRDLREHQPHTRTAANPAPSEPRIRSLFASDPMPAAPPEIGFVSSPAAEAFNPALRNPKPSERRDDNPALRL